MTGRRSVSTFKETNYVRTAVRQNEVFEKAFRRNIGKFDKLRNLQIVNDEFKIWDAKVDSRGKFPRSNFPAYVDDEPILTYKYARTEKPPRTPLSYKSLAKLSELSYKCPQIHNIELYTRSKTLTQVMTRAENSQKSITQANIEKENSKKASKIYEMRNQVLPFPLMKPSLTPDEVRHQMAPPRSYPRLKLTDSETVVVDPHEQKILQMQFRKIGNVERLRESFLKDEKERREMRSSTFGDERVLTEFHDCKRMESRGLDPVEIKRRKAAQLAAAQNQNGKMLTFKGLVMHIMRILKWTRALYGNKKIEIKWDTVRKKVPFKFDRKGNHSRNGKSRESTFSDDIEDQPCLDAMRHCRTLRFSRKQKSLVNAALDKEPIRSDYLVTRQQIVPLWAQKLPEERTSQTKSIAGESSVLYGKASTTSIADRSSSFLPPIGAR